MPCLAEVAIQKGIVRRKSHTEAWAAAEVAKMACFLQGLRLARRCAECVLRGGGFLPGGACVEHGRRR
eukprot:1327761-Alexandrium_andersonii.AAC.1